MKDNHTPMPLAVEKATKLVKAFNKMNRYAIACRYGDKTKPAKLRTFNVERKPTTVHQFFKNLECLCYQCSEGDTEKKHRTTWNKMEKMIYKYARNIAFDHPAVAAAEWG
jgi:ethanolamine utilization cobalamin adenosyltransferase